MGFVIGNGTGDGSEVQTRSENLREFAFGNSTAISVCVGFVLLSGTFTCVVVVVGLRPHSCLPLSPVHLGSVPGPHKESLQLNKCITKEMDTSVEVIRKSKVDVAVFLSTS